MLPYLTTMLLVFVGFIYSYYTTNLPSTIRLTDTPMSSPRKEPIIVKFKNESYDISTFVKHHPGGKEVLIQNKNNEIEEIMKSKNHSDKAYTMLQKYKIN